MCLNYIFAFHLNFLSSSCRLRSQTNKRSTYINSSVRKRASKVQLVPESTQKSNIVARTGSEPNTYGRSLLGVMEEVSEAPSALSDPGERKRHLAGRSSTSKQTRKGKNKRLCLV